MAKKKDLATTRVRQIEALKLRIEGHSYAEIAAKLDYESPSGAQRAALAVLDRTAKEPAEQLRAMEVARLDRLLAAVFRTAIGKGKGSGPALDRSLRIIDRRCRLLGLDAPQRLSHGFEHLSDEDLIREATSFVVGTAPARLEGPAASPAQDAELP